MTHRQVAVLLILAGLLALFLPLGWWPPITLVGTGCLLLFLGWIKPESGPYGD